MKCSLLLYVLLLVLSVTATSAFTENGKISSEAVKLYNRMVTNAKQGVSATYDELMAFATYLARQLTTQQLLVEEKIRSSGGSGIKQMRVMDKGSKTYHSATSTGSSMAASHDHSNHKATVGMGEFIVNLNGVEFRTRHNDYLLRMPHRTSAGYHETEEIPYPDVPPSVLEKTTVHEQILEMREYLRAFTNEDSSIRDYEDYFKTLLCYLEGAWTLSDENTIEESFESDRHSFAADSWIELMDRIEFAADTGGKDRLENLAYLPAMILGVEEGKLKMAQWNYRILCHPLSRHIPPSRLVPKDDIGPRFGYGDTMAQHANSRRQRYSLNVLDKATAQDRAKNFDFLDELFHEIPGMDNYQGNLTDTSHGGTALHYETGEPLNTAFYHRWFRTSSKDAMGSQKQHKSYSDPNLFMAMTTQPNIPAMSMEWCDEEDVCMNLTQKFTYAIPLELIYLTPLSNWNPHDIEYKGDPKSDLGKTVKADGRDGGLDVDTAYNGTSARNFYRTPYAFFNSNITGADAADTVKDKTGVLDRDGNVHEMVSSGTPVFLREIVGVEGVKIKARVRYPIMPTHQENNAIWKAVDALKDTVLLPKTKQDKFYEAFPMVTSTDPPKPPLNFTVYYRMLESIDEFDNHIHHVPISLEQILSIKNGGSVEVVTTESWGHSHTLKLKSRVGGHLNVPRCDRNTKCFDSHPRMLKAAEI